MKYIVGVPVRPGKATSIKVISTHRTAKAAKRARHGLQVAYRCRNDGTGCKRLKKQ